MQAAVKTSVFERLGVKPVLNVRGFNTVVGGNTPTARMKEAIEEVERYYVDMRELLDRSGEAIAKLMGAEAAYVTPGAAAALAHGKGVPVLVDAAAQVYPLERFLSFSKTGADLIAYSCKYFGGPNSTGILVGRRELIEAASLQGFIGFEHVTNRKGLGRGYKLDRQEIVCAVIAVEDWLSMDHERRLADVER